MLASTFENWNQRPCSWLIGFIIGLVLCSFLAETGLVSVEHQMQEIGLGKENGKKSSWFDYWSIHYTVSDRYIRPYRSRTSHIYQERKQSWTLYWLLIVLSRLFFILLQPSFSFFFDLFVLVLTKQKHEQHGNWNKNFIFFSVVDDFILTNINHYIIEEDCFWSLVLCCLLYQWNCDSIPRQIKRCLLASELTEKTQILNFPLM